MQTDLDEIPNFELSKRNLLIIVLFYNFQYLICYWTLSQQAIQQTSVMACLGLMNTAFLIVTIFSIRRIYMKELYFYKHRQANLLRKDLKEEYQQAHRRRKIKELLINAGCSDLAANDSVLLDIDELIIGISINHNE